MLAGKQVPAAAAFFIPHPSSLSSVFRYLKEAFWAKADLPGLGALPVNALAVLGLGIVGCAEHAVWLLGAGLEAAYLYLLTTNPRFQKLISAQDLQQVQQSTAQTRQAQLARLAPPARARADQLDAKVRRVSALVRTDSSRDLLGDSNLDALEQLGALHLRLLGVEQDLQTARQQTDEPSLNRQAAALEGELNTPGTPLSPALRESKQATLELTQKRLANARRRTESLAEVGSDLARIEAQVELAAEDASPGGKPAEVSGNLNLLNRILESNSALKDGDPFSPAAAGLPPRLPEGQE